MTTPDEGLVIWAIVAVVATAALISLVYYWLSRMDDGSDED